MKKKESVERPKKIERNTRESRSAIQESAFRLFSEQGFHGTTTRQIAVAAGVSEGLIFHHFGSKLGILVVIFEEVLAGASDGLLRSLLDGESVTSLEDLLKKAFDRIEGGARTGRFSDVIRMFLNSMMAVPDREKEVFVRRVHDALWFPMTQHLSRYLKGSDIDPYVFFRMIQGSFMGYILFQEVLGWKDIVPLDAKKYRDTTVRILSGAIKSSRTTQAVGKKKLRPARAGRKKEASP